MIIFKKEQDLREYLSEQNRQGRTIGFIPTMGALHAGHRSLIEKAKEGNMLTVCSIFVNPTQFNDKNDFINYPITEDEDTTLLIDAGCDVLFIPSVDEIYPNGQQQNHVELGYIATVLEGAYRPGHFNGVAQVVERLLAIVNPQYLFLGQKDYQQCMVIKKLLELKKNDQVQLVICPTVREEDGLAMSSRNLRLTDPQRALAAIIYQCLVAIQTKQNSDNFDLVQKQCLDLLKAKGFQPEYVALANADDLSLMDNYENNTSMVALIAAKIADIRLIDNLLLN